MLLSSALHASFNGLRTSESQINVLSSNVTNADKAGYTRKEASINYVHTNDQVYAYGSTIETIDYDYFLLENLIDDTITASENAVLSEYLSRYVNDLGTVGGSNSLSAYLDDLATSISRLSTTPEDASLKANVVTNAERLTNELRNLSAGIQDYRLQVEQDIATTVTEINTSLARIDNINNIVRDANSADSSSANIEDDRRIELEKLAGLIDIDYFINASNEIQIYTSGRPLLDSAPRDLNFTPATNLDSNVIYPTGLNPIALDGTDITTTLGGGKLGGLVQLRDSMFTNEQAKLDEFATVLIDQMNTVLNQGASSPARTNIIGEVTNLAAADVFSGTGTVRIAVVDNDGLMVNGGDFNIASYGTVGAMITDINALLGPDVTLSLTAPDGQLQMVANNANQGIAINAINTTVTPDAMNFSDYFGLNGMFVGTGSDDIRISSYLNENPEFLPVGSLALGVVGVGDIAVSGGDATTINALSAVLDTQYSFNAAGNFATQTESINNYIDKMIADAAFFAQSTRENANISTSLMEQTKSTLQNISGVNIDEEMANLVDLQAKYEASATMIATIQDLFDTLLGAVR
jgi:flagellar hook-associated protein 1 FlgK